MSKKKNFQFDAAISFAGENRTLAEELKNALQARGLNVFYDKDRKAYLWGKGQGEYENIYGPKSRFVIPIVSKHYRKKAWPQHEFDIALEESKKRKQEFILPVRVDDTRLLGLHGDINYMDIRIEEVDQIADAVEEKCKEIGKDKINKRVRNNKQLNILTRKSRYALGIIATSILPTKLISLKKIFPDIVWDREIKLLRRKGVLHKESYTWEVPKAVRKTLLCDTSDIEVFNQAWIKALEPHKEYVEIAFALSVYYMRSGQLEEAVVLSTEMVETMGVSWWCGSYLSFLKLLVASDKIKHIKPERRIRLYNAIGLCLLHTGEEREAFDWFLKLRRYSLRNNNNRGIALSYLHSGVILHESGDWQKAKLSYQNAIKFSREGEEHALLAHCLNNLAQLSYDSPEEAELLLKESISLKKKSQDVSGLIASFSNLGYLAACNGQYQQASKWFSNSIKKARTFDLRYYEASNLLNLGTTYSEMGEFESARKSYKQGREIAAKEEYIEIVAKCIEAEGKLFFDKGWYKKAEQKFRKLYENRLPNEQKEKLAALGGIGVSLIKQGKLLDARKIVREALKLARKLKDWELVTKLAMYKALTYDNWTMGKNVIKQLEKEALISQETGEYRVAVELWTECLEAMINIGQNERRITTTFDNGLSCFKKLCNNYDLGIKLHVQLYRWQRNKRDYGAAIAALNMIERIATKGKLWIDQAEAIDQQGLLLQELERFEEAEELHKKALIVSRRIKNVDCMQTSLNNLGEVYRKTEKFELAIRRFLEAEKIAKLAGDYESEIVTAHNRALVLQAKNQVHECEVLLRQCRDRAQRHKIWREYVRAWEGLGNLAWWQERYSLGKKRLARALFEAKKHKQVELEPEIALNLARTLFYQEKPKEGLKFLKPYEKTFPELIDSYEYYSTLAELYKECGKFDFAEANFLLAKVAAEKKGLNDRVACFSSDLAEVYQIQKRNKLSDRELRQAIANEEDPEGLAMLLVQRLGVLLDDNREKVAEQVFHGAKCLISKHNFSELYIDLHMVLGDHMWKGEYESKLNAMQAYIVALGESFSNNTDVVVEIAARITQQLLQVTAGKADKLFDRLEKDITKWLVEEHGEVDHAMQFLLWPLRAARKMYRYRKNPRQLRKVVDQFVEDETSSMANNGG